MPISKPLPYTADVEEFLPDELETVSKITDAFDSILEKTAGDYGHAVRSVHAKAHGILKGTLTVKHDLPRELAQGMFSRSLMRFSVWTGLSAHCPLGNVNRARKAPYKHSSKFRENFNHCPIREP